MRRLLSGPWARQLWLGVATGGVALGASSVASAQAPSVELRGWSPSTDPAAGLYLEPPSAPATGDWNTALWLSYGFRPITLRDAETGDVVHAVLGHQLSGDAVFNVGLFERLAIGVDLPFALAEVGDDVAGSPEAAAVLGDFRLPPVALGDAKLALKGTLVAPTNDEFGGFSLALHERLGLPTGNTSSFLGEGAVTSETRLLFEYRLVAVAVDWALGFKARAKRHPFACGSVPEEDCDTVFGHEIPWGVGFVLWPQAFGIDPDGHWAWTLESYGYLPAGPSVPFRNAKLSQAQIAASARYAFDDVSLVWGAELGVAPGVGTAPFRATIGLAWSPRKHDVDEDGVLDKGDTCPDLKEDLDGYQDADGCPDWDNDDDGVPDADDRCADQKEDPDEFQDDDGCTDEDNDKDGILDGDDACADVPGEPNEDAALRGCHDDDPDRDKVVGIADACPTLAEDPDGFKDDDGCPEPDNDDDKILDALDACATVAGVASSDPKKNGCPDRDGDGVLDPDDKCADTAGPARADEWHGCPDRDGDDIVDAVDACPDKAGGPNADPKKNGCGPARPKPPPPPPGPPPPKPPEPPKVP
ncbi:MAG: hypothetical protein HY908_19865 [Myxococcales bacterium]|nr:hypothetical protein [Myxococcales bacterium]